MLPAVILHVPERNDLPAVDTVELREPGRVIEVRRIAVVARFVDDLAIVLGGLERRSKARARHIV